MGCAFDYVWVSKVPKEWIGGEEEGRELASSKRSGLKTAEF